MGKVILIVDDDEAIRGGLTELLTDDGYDVSEAPNVPEAINVVRTKDIDLAIVDMKMPIVDGYEFCKFLRETAKYSHIPIIILTAEEERYGREKAQDLRIEAFMDKPFDSHTLIAKVHKLLSTPTY